MDTANWLTILISAAASIAAVLAAWFAGHQSLATAEQANIAQRQQELAEQIRKDQSQPFVFVDIRPDIGGFLMMLIVENTGPTVARNIRVDFDPPLRSVKFPEVANLLFIREGIKALPPGRRISWYFDTGPSIFSSDVPKKYRVRVNAEGPFGPTEEIEYDIDFSILENSEARNPAQLKDIVDQLKKTNNTLNTIAGRISTAQNIRPQIIRSD
jgi:hypothetical protein